MRLSQSAWKRHLLVIGLYSLLALVLTYPLALRFTTHVPGDGGDDPALAWNLWWVKYALLDLGANPFHCGYMFHPIGINLAFYTLTVLNALLSIPLQVTLGLVPASNIVLLSSFVLGGYGTFLLSRHLLAEKHPPSPISYAPFVAGLVYAFSSSKLFYASLGQFNIASSQWIPFCVLFLFKMRKRPERLHYAPFDRLRTPLLAALFLLFQAWAEMTYASFLLVFAVILAAYELIRSIRQTPMAWIWQSRPSDNEKTGALLLLRNLALVGLLFAVGFAPILSAMIPDLLAEGDFFVQGSGFAEDYSADLVGFLVPTQLHPWLGSLVEGFAFPHDKGQHLFLGYTVLALALWAIVGLRRDAAVRFWAVSAGIFFLLCLGPSLRVNKADTGLPLPFLLVQQLPFFKGNRYPSRYSVLLVLALAVLVGYAMSRISERSKSRFAFRHQPSAISYLPSAICYLLFAILFTFEHLSLPLPLSDMRVPEVYRTIAAEPGDLAVLEVPLAWRNGFRITGAHHAAFMYAQFYQTVHHKRILGGNTSRNPEFKFQYFTEAPVINSLIALETGHEIDEATLKKDKALAPEVLRFLGVRYIVVHILHVVDDRDPPVTTDRVIPYVEATMPVEKFHDQGDIVAYRVTLPSPADEVTIDLDSELVRLSLAEGWGRPVDLGQGLSGYRWVQRREARLLVRLNGEAQVMSLRAFCPAQGQALTVVFNGRRLDPIALDQGWGEYKLKVPAGYVKAGLNELRFRFARLFPIEDYRLASYFIGGTATISPVGITVESAGQEVGDLGHIYVDGRNVSPEGRGYNLVVIDPQTGAIEATASFDTHLDEKASQAMADFVASIAEGRIVAVAVRDEASRLLGEEAVQALRTIGAEGDLREKFRWGQAIIGVKGAQPGQAVESLDALRPAVVYLGEGTTEPHLSAAFSLVRFMTVEE
ncbi:MAG: interleukin-like EMT inducer domain-containing protein [Anaerolineae bacterium]